jgi:hypothetical protein
VLLILVDFTYPKTCFTAYLKLCFFQLQLTFTALHLLGFVSPKDDQSLKDFLIKVRDLCLCISGFVDILRVVLLFGSKYH